MKILILALIGGLIGWVTNILAIKLMFRPLNPVKILGFEFVGLIPKRRAEIASSIGEIVETELVSMDEIVEKALTHEDKEELVNTINNKIKKIIDEKMPPFIPSSFKSMISEYVDKVAKEEIEIAIDELSENLSAKINSRIQISTMVEEKINSFDLEKLEEIIINIAKKELKHIEFLGFVLGFLIGIIQGIIIIYM